MRTVVSGRRGVALATTALALIVLIPIVGLGIDGATLYVLRMRISQAADAGCVAGARSLNVGQDLASQAASATAVATKYFYANFPVGFWGSSNPSLSVTVAQNDANRTRTVSISAGVDAPLYFMNVLNKQSARVQVNMATASRRDINVMLVLDRSGSMVNAGAIDALKSAASWFVGQFASGRDKVGLEVFGGGSYVAYSPSVNFRTSSPSVSTLVGRIVGGGATNTSQALWLAYQELRNLNEPGALNAILLFTDGQPTAFTGDFTIRSDSTCYDKSVKRGFITYYSDSHQNPTSVAGLFKYLDTSITDTNTETQAAANSSGCHYAADPTQVNSDVASLPAQDIYGNGTNTGYQAVNLQGVRQTGNIDAASINAADSAASRLRANVAFGPVIYTIGLGGTSSHPPQTAFMQRISNDPASLDFNSLQAPGLYVYCSDNSQLQPAFARIASELLRLAQ